MSRGRESPGVGLGDLDSTHPTTARGGGWEWLWWLLPSVAFVAVWARATTCGFAWDDELWYLKTDALQRPLLDGLGKTIFDLVDVTQDRPTHESYRPLAYLSAWLDAHLFGTDPRGMHAHSLAVASLYLPLWVWLGRMRGWSVWFTAVLCTWFLVHPLQAEVFVYLSGRPDLLSGLLAGTSLACSLGSLAARRAGRSDWPYLVGTGLAFALALLCKEGTVGLPLALLALLAAENRVREALRSELALTAGLVVYLAVRWVVAGGAGSAPPIRAGLVALPGVALQLAQSFVVPLDLAISRLPSSGYAIAGWILCGAGVAALVTRHWLGESASPPIRAMAWLGAGWLAWVAMVGPSAVVAVSATTVSDRYAHAATLALLVVLGAPIRHIAERLWRWRLAPPLIMGAVTIGGLVLAVVSWVQVGFWKDSEAAYRRALLVEPRDPRASYRLGSLLAQSGRVEEALPHFQQATELAPGDHIYWNDLGAAQLQLQLWQPAADSFQRSFVTGGRRRPLPLVNVALIHLRLGDRNAACEALAQAAQLPPEIPLGQQLRQRWCTTGSP